MARNKTITNQTCLGFIGLKYHGSRGVSRRFSRCQCGIAVNAEEAAKGIEEDFSAVIRRMEEEVHDDVLSRV